MRQADVNHLTFYQQITRKLKPLTSQELVYSWSCHKEFHLHEKIYHSIPNYLGRVCSIVLALRVVVAGATAEQPVRDEAAPVATAATLPGDGQAVDAGEELGARDVLVGQNSWGKQ